VLAREDCPGDKRLVAYIVAISGSIPSTNELRSFLQQKLPEYMVPSVWMFLESLPLTPNGKLNRQALPIPEQSRPELDESFSVPRTPVEELLANIWAKVLKLARVGINDNFFELGGHSLLATQVVTRIREALNVELPLRRLFRGPTIRGLATTIAEERQTAQTHQLPPIWRQAERAIFPYLSPSNDSGFSISSNRKVPSTMFLARGDSTARWILWRCNRASMKSFDVTKCCERVLLLLMGSRAAHPAFAILPMDRMNLADVEDSEKESAIELHVREEIQKPFDLARGPLLRAKLLKLSEDDHVLLLTMHHIITDGWSIGVLFRELSRLYEAFADGNVSSLDNLRIQYCDYAVWQRGWLQGDVLESQLAYWRKQLENLAILQLATDRQRPAVQRYRGAKARVHFDDTLTKKLWALSRDENATLYITLLSAFQILLSRYSGQEDIAVGSPIAGRSTSELEGLIGFFANTLVLRGDLSNNPTFREFLRRMRDVALEAYAHQDLPFEKLVEDLRPQRNLNISPLFQVMFVLQNDPRETWS
jgi:acyl carrier protein